MCGSWTARFWDGDTLIGRASDWNCFLEYPYYNSTDSLNTRMAFLSCTRVSVQVHADLTPYHARYILQQVFYEHDSVRHVRWWITRVFRQMTGRGVSIPLRDHRHHPDRQQHPCGSSTTKAQSYPHSFARPRPRVNWCTTRIVPYTIFCTRCCVPFCYFFVVQQSGPTTTC